MALAPLLSLDGLGGSSRRLHRHRAGARWAESHARVWNRAQAQAAEATVGPYLCEVTWDDLAAGRDPEPGRWAEHVAAITAATVEDGSSLARETVALADELDELLDQLLGLELLAALWADLTVDRPTEGRGGRDLCWDASPPGQAVTAVPAAPHGPPAGMAAHSGAAVLTAAA